MSDDEKSFGKLSRAEVMQIRDSKMDMTYSAAKKAALDRAKVRGGGRKRSKVKTEYMFKPDTDGKTNT